MTEIQKKCIRMEADLEMALQALSRIVEGCEANHPPSHKSIKHEASAAISEIKGGDHE